MKKNWIENYLFSPLHAKRLIIFNLMRRRRRLHKFIAFSEWILEIIGVYIEYSFGKIELRVEEWGVNFCLSQKSKNSGREGVWIWVETDT